MLVSYNGIDPVKLVTEILFWLLKVNIGVGPVHEAFTTTLVSTAVSTLMVQIRVKLIPVDRF